MIFIAICKDPIKHRAAFLARIAARPSVLPIQTIRAASTLWTMRRAKATKIWIHRRRNLSLLAPSASSSPIRRLSRSSSRDPRPERESPLKEEACCYVSPSRQSMVCQRKPFGIFGEGGPGCRRQSTCGQRMTKSQLLKSSDSQLLTNTQRP